MSDTITGAPSLESLSERATPGPWTVVDVRGIVEIQGRGQKPIVHWSGFDQAAGTITRQRADARFAAALANDFRANRLHTSEALAQAVAAAREEMGWRDIATAPKDRTRVLVAVPSNHAGEPMIVGEAYFDPDHEGGAWWWSGTGPGSYHDSPIHETNAMPTHWRPLPAPPTPAQTDTAPGGRADGGR